MHTGDLSWPLRRAAALRPDDVAVVCGARSVSYRDLDRRARSAAVAVGELGVSRGGRVGFLGANSLAHLEAWLGIPAAGRVLVDLNFRLAEDELAFMVDDAGIEALVVDDERLEAGRALQARCSSLRTLILDGAQAAPAGLIGYEELTGASPAPPEPCAEAELATISYTGGTTGTPKGVMLSHGNLLANARHNLIVTGHRADDRFLHVSPMFHVAGTANVFAATWVGAAQVVLPRFDARAVLEAIERERVTLTLLVPTMLAMLLEEHEARPGADLSTLRNLHYAASPISAGVQRRAIEVLPCEVAQMYGMTEAAPSVTWCTPDDHRRGHAGEEPYRTRLASMGAPIPGVEVEVRRPDDTPADVGEVGEVCVRGPNVMLGYWRRPEATEDALRGGWYRTGDAAYADGCGYLYMVDRYKDMIISGAENVYSIEVEQVLAGHPAVLEAAVFGIPHPQWGEAVHAVVVPVAGAQPSAEELIAWCRGRIAGYKTPRSVALRAEALPRSGAGKVLKSPLREPHWAGIARRVS
jgi:long-chain acyl-CoA synthetase